MAETQRTVAAPIDSPVTCFIGHLVVCLTLSLVLCSCGCERPDKSQLLSEVFPDWPPGTAAHLLHDEDEAFLTFARETGAPELERIERGLRRYLLSTDAVEGMPAYDTALMCLDRVTAAQQAIYKLDGARLWYERLRSLHDSELDHLRQLVRQREALTQADRSPATSGTVSTLPTAFEELGFPEESARTWLALEKLSGASTNRRYIDEALRCAQQAKRADMICDVLVASASAHAVRASTDSMVIALGRALDLAVEHRLAHRAGEIAYAYSHYCHSRGREGLAAELREAAVQYSREFRGAPAVQIRLLSRAMSVHAAYGNWELVERDLGRARSCLSEVGDRGEREQLARGLDLYLARLLMKQGRVEEANARFSSLEPGVQVLVHWAESLLESNQPAQAREAIRRGQELAARIHAEPLRLRFGLQEVEAHRQLGDLEPARRTLEALRIDHLGTGLPWAEFDMELSQARLEQANGASASAHRSLANARRELESTARRDSAGAMQHRIRIKSAQLRTARRELAGSEPTNSYRSSFDDPKLADQLLRWSRSDRRYHLLFLTSGDQIVRWTLGNGVTDCDTLAVSATTIADQVKAVLAHLTADPGRSAAAADPELAEESVQALADLARDLLPKEVLKVARASESTGRPYLYITADGALRLFPFETLSLSPGPYQPLIDAAEVAYLSITRTPGIEPARPAARGPDRNTLIVSSPQLPAALQRRYPGLTDLTGSRREAEHLRSLLPNSVLLEGPAATRSAFLRQAPQATRIYVAAHVVRDPQNPVWTFLPLAEETGQTAAVTGSRLERIDILRTDLSQCDLVVLSGCASGAPHVAETGIFGSLADAFLDAGASCVIQTLWHIQDDTSASLMERFHDILAESGHRDGASVDALNQARREFRSGTTRHPYYWAPFTSVVGVLDRDGSGP